jgi:ThiS family
MSIKLIVDGPVLENINGKVQVEVRGNTVVKCIYYLVQRQPSIKKFIFDDKGNLCQGNLISLNGTFIENNDLSHPVKDGDEIWIMKSSGF